MPVVATAVIYDPTVPPARQAFDEGLSKLVALLQPNAFFFVWSLGQAIDEPLLRAFFESLHPYVDRGDLVWQTLLELVKAYRAPE